MKGTFLLTISFVSVLFLVIGCSPKTGDMVVLEIGNNKVTLGEYENFYMRNTGGLDTAKQSSQEEREKFLDLLTNYKLKLQDAYDRKLQNDSDIIEELRDYRSSLAQTFLIDREITEPGIKQLYDRRLEEIRAQHILLSVKPDASPEETLKIWNKALDIIKRAKSGEKFDSLVIKFSEDRSASLNHGDMYYFTGGQMLAAFENAAYALKKGDISSLPVRTQFGYHIIKILDRQPTRGTIKARHIMTGFSVSNDSTDTLTALKKIKAMQDSLKKGWDFGDLASKFSDDKNSAVKGGDLGFFERRKWIQPFDETAFKLNVGEVSDIIRTPYGYHLIKCDSIQPPPPFSDVKEEIKKAYQQFRFTEDNNAYIVKWKKEFNYSFNDSVFNAFLSCLDSMQSVGDSGWDKSVPDNVRSLPIFVLNNRPVTVDSVIKIFNKRAANENSLLRKNDLKPRVDKLGETLVTEEHAVGLEKRNNEFANLMKEYQDGVILFKAEQLEVWNKIVVNDSLLKKYYDDNKSRFMFPERVDISQINLESDTLAAMVYDSLINGADFGIIADRYNSNDPDLRGKKGAVGLQPVDRDDLTQQAAKMSIGAISEPLETDNGVFAILKLNDKLQAREKSFQEAGAEVSNSFQESESKRAEQQWLSAIKLRYSVIQHKDVLNRAFTSHKKPD